MEFGSRVYQPIKNLRISQRVASGLYSPSFSQSQLLLGLQNEGDKIRLFGTLKISSKAFAMAPSEINQPHPNRNFVARNVRIGGVDKSALLNEMERHRIKLNEAGKALFAYSGFTTTESISIVPTVEIAVANLGFDRGAVFADILEKAFSLGLAACPLELGPHLRLQLLDQQEHQNDGSPTQHRAPPGSITVFSPLIAEEEKTPQGFYLRRIDGVLWLRGYWSGPEHIWSPEDHLIFARRP